ncbi:MAG: serpin family protein [Selenomonadaceae bacterium]|nr:serpin family protein [Selenomonadaceae bacterium]
MKKFFATVIFMLSLTSFACAANESVGVEPPRNLSTSVDEFCWKYFGTLNRDENIFYSPYGIDAALSILANGASGDTRTEILHALAANNVDALNDEHKKFSEFAAKNYRDENIFMESNLLLIDKKFFGRGLDKKFQRVVKDAYKSDVREANFSGDVDGERKKISRWVSDKTAGFIPNYNSIVTPDTLTDLLNVVYFKGKWLMPFNAKNTSRQDFTNRDGSKVEVDMMRKVFEDAIAYHADEKFCGIELPYSEHAAMYLILPVDENALDVAERWHNEELSYRLNFLDRLKNSSTFDGEVVVRLPKFELDIENNLVESFKSMGLVKSFTDVAEFFNIINDTPLKISNAKHRAKVQVDEEGTEAAAITEIAMTKATAIPDARPPKVVHFYADRPFLFVIRDIESNITLFAGTVNSIRN